MINTIGAELIESIEDAHRATHVIPSNGVVEMRRTAKLMVCLCTTAIILLGFTLPVYRTAKTVPKRRYFKKYCQKNPVITERYCGN